MRSLFVIDTSPASEPPGSDPCDDHDRGNSAPTPRTMVRRGLPTAAFLRPLVIMHIGLAAVVWREGWLAPAFWWIIVIGICGLLPLHASTPLPESRDGGGAEAEPSGWRVVLEKWGVVTTRQILAALTALPYLLTMHSTDGAGLERDLFWLAVFLVMGLAASGFLAGFSWVSHVLVRSVIIVGVLWINGVLAAEAISDGGDFWDGEWAYGGWTGWTAILTALAHAVFSALDTAARRTGKPSEHPSAPRRIAAVTALCVYTMLVWLEPDGGVAEGLSTLFVIGTTILVAAQAMSENPGPSVPGRRHGLADRVAGLYLDPGWPGGIRFSFVICGAFFFFFHLLSPVITSHGATHGGWDPHEAALRVRAATLGMMGALAVPPVIYHLFLRRRIPWNAGIYLLLLALTAAGQMAIFALAKELERGELLYPAMVLPSVSLSVMRFIPSPSGAGAPGIPPEAYLDLTAKSLGFITLLVTAVWWRAALALSSRGLREIRDADNAAAPDLPSP